MTCRSSLPGHLGTPRLHGRPSGPSVPILGLVIRDESAAKGTCGSSNETHFITKDDLSAEHGDGNGNLCEAHMERRINLEDLQLGPAMNLLAIGLDWE